MKLVQITFPHQGPWGDEMADKLEGLARSIAQEPGLRWKIWTENQEAGIGGGVYLFEDETSADAYIAMHTARLEGFGYSGIQALKLDVNQRLSQIDRAPLV